MASRTANSRYSSGTSSPSAPSFARPTRSTAARTIATASTPRRVATNPTPRSPPSSVSSTSGSRYDDEVFSSTSHTAAVEAKTGKKVETLYSHPNVRIIAFSATARTLPKNPQSPTKEVLTWSSHLERTIAVGTFKIYRAPGSVAFLNCGSALQPILPKSQCWCLDEESSKFVLQIRRPNYWRIELPLDSSDDCHRAELLREVMKDILLFEQTPCPFERSFVVELPEQPPIIGRKQPWQPSSNAYVSPLGPYDRTPHTDPPFNRPGRSGSINSNSNYPFHERQSSGGYDRPGTSHSESSYSEISETESDYTDSSYLATPRAEISEANVRGSNLDQLSAENRRQEWIRKQYVHSLSENKGGRSSYTEEYSDFDDDISDVGSVVSDLTHVRTMTSRSLYSRQRETTIFEAEDATPRISQNPSRSIRRPGSEIHEGSGMGGNSVVKKRLRRNGFQPSRPPHLNLGSASNLPSKPTSRPQSPLDLDYLPPQPLIMAPRPPGMKSHSARARASTASSRSSTSTITGASEKKPEKKVERKEKEEEKRPNIPPSPASPNDGFRNVMVEWDASKQPMGCMPPTPPDTKIDTSFAPQETKSVEPVKAPESESKPEIQAPIEPEVKKAKVQEKTLKVETIAEVIEKIAVPSTPKIEVPCPGSPIYTALTIPNIRQRPRHRTTTSISHRGAFTPLPSAAQLFSPPRIRRLGPQSGPTQVDNVKNIPWSIVAKTCDLIMGPPGNLMKLMLRVAARIVAGEWRGVVYGRGADGREIPVKWDYTDMGETEYDIPSEAMTDGVTFDNLDENGDDYYTRGRRLASSMLTPDIEDLD